MYRYGKMSNIQWVKNGTIRRVHATIWRKKWKQPSMNLPIRRFNKISLEILWMFDYFLNCWKIFLRVKCKQWNSNLISTERILTQGQTEMDPNTPLPGGIILCLDKLLDLSESQYLFCTMGTTLLILSWYFKRVDIFH